MAGANGASRPAWFDPRMPTSDQCVIAPLLEQAEADCPERVFAVFGDGRAWTFADLVERVSRRAAGLAGLGVRPNDLVLVWLPNGPSALLTWFATNLLGGCFVPVNTAYRGQLLAHVIANSGARLLVTHPSLLSRLSDIDTAALEAVVTVSDGPEVTLPGRLRLLGHEVLDAQPHTGGLIAERQPWDLQSIIYTSGTTGPSKGVLSSYFHLYTAANVIHGHMSSQDRIFVNAPLFHLGGTCAVLAALLHRGSIALVDGFSAQTFWPLIKSTGSTLTSGLLGSMAPYLARCASSEDRHDNPLRRTHFYPVSETTSRFANEFDFEYFSGYGSTEVPLVLVTDVDSAALGSSGKVRSGVECRLVDENDQPVAPGCTGELIVRTDHPWSLATGYHQMPQATADAWRNGWFHTGDLLRQDENGNYYFVDRRKDAIRRRGENISSQEVEAAVYEHQDVSEAAAIGVPSEFGEDDVLIAVAPKPGATLQPGHLFDFLRPRLAHFMLPRYMRIMEELPKTPTDKVQKHVLKSQGVTQDTWDREAEGHRVKRDTLQGGHS